MNQIDVGQLCSFCYYSLISFYYYVLLIARNIFEFVENYVGSIGNPLPNMTIRHCVIPQKSAYLTDIAAEG
jgi:hypothetical protein